MNILKHAGNYKIITSDPLKIKHDVSEIIYREFRYPFSDLAPGKDVIQFSGRTGRFLIPLSPLSLIDEGEIKIKESKHYISIAYFIRYSQLTVMWSAIAILSLITFLVLFLLDKVPFLSLLSPFIILGIIAVMVALTILRFESLLERCLIKIDGERIRIPT